MCDTTRKYPRTLSDAFPGSPEYGCAIIRTDYPNPLSAKALVAAVVVVALLAALVLTVHP